MENGSTLIAIERDRQILNEGFSSEHDAQYDREELLEAAKCYLLASEACHYSKSCVTYNGGYRPGEGVPSDWPWDEIWWKPSKDPIRNLEKAGALIAAQIDKLQLSDQ